MKSRNYKVHRENIYVGSVVRTNKIYFIKEDNPHMKKETEWLDTETWTLYRNILFVPNDALLADDLLYNSPNYPILNMTDLNLISLKGNNTVIKDTCNLNEILKYFNFNSELTYEDIIKIRKIFFTGRFAMDNCSLFGYTEIEPSTLKPYDDGLDRSYNTYRKFTKTNSGILSDEYWYALDQRGNNKLIDVIYYENMSIDTFKPSKKEGKIKSLKHIKK